jgi:hypothetical protein
MRRFMLTLHIGSSVGWLGAVIAFLALAVAAITSPDVSLVRGSYLAMDLSARLVLFPLSLVSLISGVIQSLGTKWGLFRHYWVVAKLVINVLASAILWMYTDTLAAMAGIAAQADWSAADLAILHSPTAILHTGGALIAISVALVLSVYKPKGLTPYGWQRQMAEKAQAS